MTFVGKILVVLQVILSVCFMTFAAAVFTVHDTWKAKTETSQQQFKEAQQKYTVLEEDFNKFKDDLDAQVKELTDRGNTLDNQRQFFKDDFDREKKQHDTTKTERDTQRALATIAGDEAKIRRDEAIKQRTVNVALHKEMNELTRQLRVAEDELFNRQVMAIQFSEKHARMLEELSLLRRVVAENGITVDPSEYATKQDPAEDVVGVVMETKKADRNGVQLIKISIGSDDGLAKGHSLYVYRTGLDTGRRAKYLGMIEIVYVTADAAVGEVIQRAKNGVIEVSDNVSTQL